MIDAAYNIRNLRDSGMMTTSSVVQKDCRHSKSRANGERKGADF
jgi:hypothetical protein